MASTLLVRGARQLVTLRGPSGPRRGHTLTELGIIPDGAVLIRDGVIDAMGATRQVANLAASRGADEIDATGCVVMPAFVDLEASLAHSHPSPRSFERLLRNYNNPDREVFRDVVDDGSRAMAGLSSHSLRRRAAKIGAGMLRYGTGTVEACSGYDLDETGMMKVLRVQNDLGGLPLEVFSTLSLYPPRGGDSARWVEWVVAKLLPTVKHRRAARFVCFHYDREAVPVPLVLRVLEEARLLGFGVKVHTDFFAESSGVPLAIRACATSVSNVTSVNADEINALANSSTIAIVSPGTSLHLGLSRATPGRAIIDAGCIPALASRYHAELSPSYNMQMIMLLACRICGMRPEEAICAATINAAHAIHAAAAVGSLECGKQADLLVLGVPDYREVAYYAGVNIVRTAIKKGRVVYDGAARANGLQNED